MGIQEDLRWSDLAFIPEFVGAVRIVSGSDRSGNKIEILDYEPLPILTGSTGDLLDVATAEDIRE